MASRIWLEQHGHYSRGFLPYAGGFLDQPAIFCEAMAIISAQVSRSDE